MLEWKVKKNSGNNDYWQSQNYEIYQTILNNCIVYVPYDKSTNQPVGTYNTLQEAKQSCEPVEKPYEVGYFEERKWGSFEILAVGPEYVVKKLIIKPGKSTSLQWHLGRNENWVVIRGLGKLITDSEYGMLKELSLQRNDTVYIPKKVKHKIEAVSELCIIETWFGNDLRESDIVRLD